MPIAFSVGADVLLKGLQFAATGDGKLILMFGLTSGNAVVPHYMVSANAGDTWSVPARLPTSLRAYLINDSVAFLSLVTINGESLLAHTIAADAHTPLIFKIW